MNILILDNTTNTVVCQIKVKNEEFAKNLKAFKDGLEIKTPSGYTIQGVQIAETKEKKKDKKEQKKDIQVEEKPQIETEDESDK